MNSIKNRSAWAANFNLMSLSAFAKHLGRGTNIPVAEGRLQIVPWEKKEQRFVVFTSSCSPSIRYSVAIPDHLVMADGATFLHKSGKTFLRVNIIKRRTKPGTIRVFTYPDPKTGDQLRFVSALLYEKRGRNWVLVRADGRPVE